MNNLLQSILDKCDRGNCPDSKWPNAKGEYWGLCPFCGAPEIGEFSFNATRFHCFGCGAEGGLRKLAEKLGIEIPSGMSDFFLKDYAKAKHFDIEFLKDLGLSERRYHYYGKPVAVRMPYLDESGLEVAVRWRLALSGENRFRWNKGSKIRPYGLWRLKAAGEKGYLWLVEGESDAQTLWLYDEPALGIPGAATWKASWTNMLPEGIDLYIWHEPDQGGDTLVSMLATSLPDAKVVYPPEGRKDISECHIKGDEVSALLIALKSQAVSIAQITSAAKRKAAGALHKKAQRLLACPSILDEYIALCRRMGLVGEENNAKLIYLALTSRLLDKPVSVAVKGPSSGGKSFTVETVLRAFPDSAYLDFTSMSDHALVYDDRPIEHRFIVLYEASGLGREKPGEINNLAYMLRSLLSEGCIKYTTVVKGEEGLQPRVIQRNGPTGLIVTTTWAMLHAENETRLLSINVKDDTEQTKGVFLALAERANGNLQQPPDLSGWHALQDWLEMGGDRNVSIPYAKTLAELADPGAVRLRRDFSKVISLIQAHAILHQAQRERDQYGRIIATLEDYAVVHGLVADVMSEGVQAAVSDTVRETVGAVAGLIGKDSDSVTVAQLAAALNIDKGAASRRQAVARELGYLINQEDKRGRPARLILGEKMPEDKAILPDPSDFTITVDLLTAKSDRRAIYESLPSPDEPTHDNQSDELTISSKNVEIGEGQPGIEEEEKSNNDVTRDGQILPSTGQQLQSSCLDEKEDDGIPF